MGASPLSGSSQADTSTSSARIGRTMSTCALRVSAVPPPVPAKLSPARSLSPHRKKATPEAMRSRVPTQAMTYEPSLHSAHRRSKSTHVHRPSVSFKLDLEPNVLRAPALTDSHRTPTAEHPFPFVPQQQAPPTYTTQPQIPPVAPRSRSTSRARLQAPVAMDPAAFTPTPPPSYLPSLYTPYAYTITLGPNGPVYSPPQQVHSLPQQVYNTLPAVVNSPPQWTRGRTLPSKQLGPFMHLRHLPKGSHGTSMISQDQGTGRVVCTRIFKKKDMLKSQAFFDGLLAELLCYKRIQASPVDQCHFLMSIHASLQDETNVIFAMPLMDCDLLATMKAKVPKQRARRWVAQIAVGLDALHHMGIIHRDIKPENILLDAATDTVRIADFNAAYLQPGLGSLDDDTVYTREWVGSKPYMAPEIVQRRWYGKMVDWWALGCLVFDLAAGQLLFDNDAQRERFMAWKPKKEGMSYLRWAADLSDEEESMIFGLLQTKPGSRYQLRHLRTHPYFFDEQGVSVFHGGTHVPAPCTPPSQRVTAVSPELKDAPLCRAEIGVRHSSSDADAVYDFRSFEWLNPSGLWGKSDKEW